MKQEDKELLLKDLCARLPYGVVVNYNGLRPLFSIEPTQHFQITLDNALDGEHNGLVYVSLDVDGEEPKPYLRPMSSMTEKEAKELSILYGLKNILSTKITDEYIEVVYEMICYDEIISSIEIFDWLNKHHFDYRYLIEKHLAIEVTKKNNPYSVKIV